MLTLVRRQTSQRILEVRQTLTVIRSLESSDPLKPDPPEAISLRGLFYVHLYAAFEYAVTNAIQALLVQVSHLQVDLRHLEHLFHAVALDADFTSVGTVKGDKKWLRRRELLSRQLSTDKCAPNDSAFSMYLQNIWYATLEDVFLALCISGPVLPDPGLRGYIDEIVGKRNEVSHGRESAGHVGSGTRSPDLAIRLDAIIRVVDHIFASLEAHVVNREFITASHRPQY